MTPFETVIIPLLFALLATGMIIATLLGKSLAHLREICRRCGIPTGDAVTTTRPINRIFPWQQETRRRRQPTPQEKL